MTQIDFSMLRQSPFAGALDPISSAISDVVKRRHEEAMQEQRLAEMRRQTDRLMARDKEVRDREERRLSLQEKREVGNRTSANLKARQTTEDAIRSDLAAGDFGRAESRGSGYFEQDPETGEVRNKLPGFDVDRGTLPPDVAPLVKAGAVEYGPQSTPEISEEAAVIRSGQQPTPEAGEDGGLTMGGGDVRGEFQRLEDERKRFAGQNTPTNEPELGQRQVALEEFSRKQANPEFSVGGVRVNPDDLRHAAGRTAAADMGELGRALQSKLARAVESGDPIQEAAAQRQLERFQLLYPQVESGALPLAKAALDINAAATAEDKRGQQREHDVLVGDQAMDRTTATNASAERRAEIAARAAATRAATPRPPSETAVTNAENNTHKMLTSEVDTFAKRRDVYAEKAEGDRFQLLIKNADNPSVQRSIAYSALARGLNGEKGPLSKDDIHRIQDNLAGMWGQVENWISTKGTGHLSDDVMKVMMGAVNAVIEERKGRRDRAMEEFSNKFLAPGSTYMKRGMKDQVLNEFEALFGPGSIDEMAEKAKARQGAAGAGAGPAPAAPPDDGRIHITPGPRSAVPPAAEAAQDDPNDERPLGAGEQMSDEELAPPTGGRPQRQGGGVTGTVIRGVKYTRQQLEELARRRGLIK